MTSCWKTKNTLMPSEDSSATDAHAMTVQPPRQTTHNRLSRWDYQKMAEWISPHSRILDLGCGDGDLLRYLMTHKQVSGYGIECDAGRALRALSQGVSVIKRDAELCLSEFDDESFDYVIMSQSLQAMRSPEGVLYEVMRIGRQAIVSFPNMGYWRNRADLLLRGSMPVNRYLPETWYQTENIHLCTISDFVTLCRKKHYDIKAYNTERGTGRGKFFRAVFPNLTNPVAIYLLKKSAVASD